MAPNAIRTLEYAEHLICNTHGVTRRDCRDVHRLVSIATTASVGASVGALFGGRDAAALGGLAGMFLGAAYPEFAEWVRNQNLVDGVQRLSA